MFNLGKITSKSWNNIINVFGFKQFNKNMNQLLAIKHQDKLFMQNKYSFNSQKPQPPQKNNLNQQKPNQNPKQQPKPKFNPQQQITQQQQALIKSHQPDQVFNTLLNLQAKHNFQKDLIIARKIYQRSTKQLRANILFQDLLKSQAQILMYDTKSKPFFHMWMKNLFNLLFFGLTIWFINQVSNMSQKNKIILERTTSGKYLVNIVYGFAGWFLIFGLWKYFRFQRRFVQKIIYDTKSQNFYMTKRGFFGSRYAQQVSRFKIVYTQNKFLNKKGTNYFNIETKDQYSIPYKQAWIKQDLFSHLIAQRIKI